MHTFIRTYVSVLIGVMWFIPVAYAGSCDGVLKSFGDSSYKTGCECGPALNNLKVTIPSGLHLVAACSLRWTDGALIEIRKEAISLDKYKDEGHYVHGSIFLSGAIELEGRIRYEPGPAGDWWFYPDWSDAVKRKLFVKTALSPLKYTGQDYPEFRITKDAARRPCTEARARIRLNGIRVFLFDTDEGGAHPIGTKVLKVSTYKKCSD